MKSFKKKCTFPVFGPSHTDGGIQFFINDTQPVELEGFEWVLRHQILSELVEIKDNPPIFLTFLRFSQKFFAFVFLLFLHHYDK